MSATAIVVFSEALHEIAMNLPEQSKGKKSNQECKLRFTEHLAPPKITLYRDIEKSNSSHTECSQSHGNAKVAQRILVSFCQSLLELPAKAVLKNSREATSRIKFLNYL